MLKAFLSMRVQDILPVMHLQLKKAVLLEFTFQDEYNSENWWEEALLKAFSSTHTTIRRGFLIPVFWKSMMLMHL